MVIGREMAGKPQVKINPNGKWKYTTEQIQGFCLVTFRVVKVRNTKTSSEVERTETVMFESNIYRFRFEFLLKVVMKRNVVENFVECVGTSVKTTV